MSNLNVKFIKNAEHIDLVRTNSEKAEYDLHINDETVHLNSRHPFSRYASLTTPESVIDSLKGGHFVVDDGTLKEYRDASYKGFMHNDDFIERFANDNTLLKRASDNIHIAEYGHGGSFDISAGFTWSAFSKNLKTNMEVFAYKSGPMGGDQQIGSRISEGLIDIMIFFWDPLEAQPHDPDVKALLRIAVLYDIPVANNRASADFILSSPLINQKYERHIYDFERSLTERNKLYRQ